MFQVLRVRCTEPIDPGSGTLPDGDGRGVRSGAGEREVEIGESGTLQAAAALEKEPPRRSGKAMGVGGPLLQLGHDQPVLHRITPANEQARFAALLDAS